MEIIEAGGYGDVVEKSGEEWRWVWGEVGDFSWLLDLALNEALLSEIPGDGCELGSTCALGRLCGFYVGLG